MPLLARIFGAKGTILCFKAILWRGRVYFYSGFGDGWIEATARRKEFKPTLKDQP